MQGTGKTELSLKQYLYKTMTDPVLLYTVLIMMSIMYHYRASLIFAYGFATYVLGWFVFRVFEFMNKHRLIGAVAYMALGATTLVTMRLTINKGHENYPILWSLWFLTPQSAVKYNKWYTIAVFVMFFMFMASVIYYFTRIRYRIFMNFLIFIIPFAIYGKEDEKMPTLFIIMLAAAYVLLMVRFRQLNDTPQSQVVCRHELWKPVAVYTALFAAFAAIVPKPYIEADRTVLENLINADELVDRLDAMLNVFRNTTTAQQYRAKVKETPVYYAIAQEPLRLKTETFTHYDYATDQWSVDDPDRDIMKTDKYLPMEMFEPGEYMNAYLYAANLDHSFAEKYGLEDYIGTVAEIPEEKSVDLISVYRRSDCAPVPQFATRFSEVSDRGEARMTYSGLMTLANGEYTGFGFNSTFGFEYSSDTFIALGKNKEILDVLCSVNYDEMTREAKNILYASTTDAGDKYYRALCEQDDIFLDDEDIYTEDVKKSDIKSLAKQITKGVDSDYEKAKILESYFYYNDYVYDLDYDTSGTNVLHFLFESKTGVCYEYATAMVLLARAAGIPARFCGGYNMTELNEDGPEDYKSYNYVVMTRDYHAFPELYIKGYGWMSFEPTMADSLEEKDKTTATDLLARAGLIILTTTLLILAFAMLYPRISHRIFMILSKKKRPAETVEAAMRRICKLYRIDSGCTSQEASALVAARCGADISRLAGLFDKAVYGEEELNSDEKQVIMEEYVQAYRLYMEHNRIFHRKTAVNS